MNEPDQGDVHVSIVRDGAEVFNQTVAQGTKAITLSGQTGSGTVTYMIVVNFSEGWEQTVTF